MANDAEVTVFLAAVSHPTRRADAHTLDALFREITGWSPQMWSGSIVGYGRYRYRYESGRAGEALATGFSPRKANLSIYVMPGYADMDDLLPQLGKHKMGKACLYINKLADVDVDVLSRILRRGLETLSARYPVEGS